jgi:hypothetical protein
MIGRAGFFRWKLMVQLRSSLHLASQNFLEPSETSQGIQEEGGSAACNHE